MRSMTPGPRVTVDETQIEIAPASARTGRLAYVWAVNGTGADVYLSVWSGTGTSRTAAQRAGGPWLLPDGFAAPVLIEVRAELGAVLAAHTGSALTGAPASAIEVVPMWEH
jgi:hypothetical protein